MELRNEPKIGLEFRLQKVVVVASIMAVLITVSVFVYTNLSSRSDTYAGVQSTSNTITGNVFCDLNQDGSQANFEDDLSGVKLWLYSDTDGDGVIDNGETIIDSTTTNSSGEYSFTPSYSSGAGSITVKVSSDNDDADEKGNGDVKRGSNYLRMNNRIMAFHFKNVAIPQGTTISTASVTMNAWSSNSSSVTVQIYADDVDDSDAISSSDDDISDRTPTSEKEDWTFSTWSYDVDYATPDIADVIQEIVNRSGWQSGNDITIIFKKNGSSGATKKVTARDYDSYYAPKLNISYSTGSGSSSNTNNYIVKVDSSLYSGATMTTPYTQAAAFSSSGNTDSGNDFGLANACGKKGKNLIRGKMFNDANKNGAKDNGEGAGSNVKVYLHQDTDGSGTLNNGDNCVDSTTSNSAGMYKFVVDYSDASASTTTFEKRISSNGYDAEEKGNGDMSINDDDLDLNEYTVGLFYNNVTIPQGATITSAYVRFRAEDHSSSTAGSVKIYGEDVDDADSYSYNDDDITDRTKTSNYETWSMPKFTKNQYYNSEDVSSVIQEIVNRSGWSSGNDLSLIFVPNGGEDRDAISRDESSSSAPKLVITYSTASANSNKYILEIDSASNTNVEQVTTTNTVAVSFDNSGNQSTEVESGVYDPSTLPVDLIYFDANYSNGQTELVWATSMEENNSHFEIERSVDGREFERIGEEPGNGNSQNIIEYSYYDQDVPDQGDPIYYRFKQVDYDGGFEYSPVVYVRAGEEKMSNIYPNPANSFINVSKNGYRFTARLIDQSGNTVDIREMEMNNTQFNVSSIPNGFYIVEVLSRQGTESFKVLVKH
ncbi:MAG: T9SS type A sorting domain-containing protein [Bacteroidia bacterium]|nr:T9SS type A sorting domain-containing protein [Bacteroidia bacterium]